MFYGTLTGRKELASRGLKQQYDHGHFKLLNVGTSEQTADVFTKPFTEKNKWVHALKADWTHIERACRVQTRVEGRGRRESIGNSWPRWHQGRRGVR